jgi:poly(A) polymerase/tRNA nucleotidyltransferase (CCA-adding enzyme)
MKINIPVEILKICNQLTKNNFVVYLVGGCVRDLVLGRKPKDWDLATDAKPEDIQRIFPDSIYENKFGTVAVKTDSDDVSLQIIELTTFRQEGRYSDKRHPEEVKFAKTIEDDLSRRDFTINAIALDLKNNKDGFNFNNVQHCVVDVQIIDPFDGLVDLKKRVIRTVGDPEERFNEDALRLMRAIRLSIELDFSIEEKTFNALKKCAGFIEFIAKERIRDELIKILLTERAALGIQALEDAGLLHFIWPELREGIGVSQNKHHIYTVWEHNLKALDYAARKNYSLEVRLASLLHDVGKPRTKKGDGPDSTFYAHEIIGAKMAVKMLDRLHFSKNCIEKVSHLIRFHLFYYNVGEVTEAGVRRFLNRVGPENVEDLIKVREADRIGSGVPKAVPYKLRHLLFMIEKVKHDPISPKMLLVNGNDVMKILNTTPSPIVGKILVILLDEVLNDPKKNNREYLEMRIQELGRLDPSVLEGLALAAEKKKNEFELGVEEEIKKKYYVK